MKVCALLEKPARARTKVAIDYKGFVIEDVFVVGYGLDFGERYRNLPFIGVMPRGGSRGAQGVNGGAQRLLQRRGRRFDGGEHLVGAPGVARGAVACQLELGDRLGDVLSGVIQEDAGLVVGHLSLQRLHLLVLL